MSGALKALLCVEDKQTKIIEALVSLGYQCIIPDSAAQTLEQIKSVPYQVIVLEDGFLGMSTSESPIYRELIHMAMSLRRKTFLILLSKQVKHLDPMCAFSMSANLLLDKERIKEEKKLATLFQREIAQQTEFYQVYNRVKEQINEGK